MLNRQEIRQALPHGCLNQIASRAGVSPAVVTNWFRLRSNNQKVAKAALEVLAEQKATEKQVKRQFKAALRGEKI